MSYVLIAVSQPLSELEHLNLGYNCLQRAPTLGLSARAKLLTLNLRNNELETINGKVDWRRQSQNFLSWPLNTDNQSLSDQTERWANPFTELREEWVKQMEKQQAEHQTDTQRCSNLLWAGLSKTNRSPVFLWYCLSPLSEVIDNLTPVCLLCLFGWESDIGAAVFFLIHVHTFVCIYCFYCTL